jgi:hypothetical protein
MSQYTPEFLHQYLKPSKVGMFFSNFDFTQRPQATPQELQMAKIEKEANSISRYLDTYKNVAPQSLLESYIKSIDREMVHPSTMPKSWYIIPYSKGMAQYDPERTQYSPPRTQEEKEKIKAYNELMRELRGAPATEEDLEHKLWRLGRDYT